MAFISAFFDAFWTLFEQSALWLLIGFTLAGLMKIYLPAAWLSRQLGRQSLAHSVKAAIIGAPLPLCSCGVIPAAVGLKRRGASDNATAAFLVATPETGVDSIAVSYALLGPIMAVVRPISALVSAIATAEWLRWLTSTDAAKPEAPIEKPSAHKSDCCGGHHPAPTRWQRLREGASFAYGSLLADTINWLLLGLVFASLVQVLVPAGWLAEWGDGLLAMTLVVLISIPMYICATASTPVAAGLLMAGVSPGAVLVFMLTGPATNIATIAMVGREMGKKALLAYLTGVVGSALACGYGLNLLTQAYGWTFGVSALPHEHGESLYASAAAVVLVALILRHYLRRLPWPAPAKPTHQA